MRNEFKKNRTETFVGAAASRPSGAGNNLDTYFGKVQKQVCVAGVGVPVLAAVQAPTLGELIADAAARASERLSERIAKGDR